MTWATTWWTPGVVGTLTVRGCPAPPTRTPLTVIVTCLIRLPRMLTRTPAALVGPWTSVAVPPPVVPAGVVTVFFVSFVSFGFFAGPVPTGVVVVGVVVVVPPPPL